MVKYIDFKNGELEDIADKYQSNEPSPNIPLDNFFNENI